MDRGMPILRMVGISKSFPGVKALENVNLDAYSGKVMALLGENGAGKSTLMNILCGIYSMDEGKIYIEGKEVLIHSIKDAQDMGISIIHQELSLLPNLTVWENIFLGNEIYNKLSKRINKAEMRLKAREFLDQEGCSIDTDILVKDLTVGEMQMVEIVKAVSRNVRILVMDEATAALTDSEIQKLFALIKKLTSQGIAVIYISHRLDEIFKICDMITVLRDGKYIGQMDVSEVTKDDLISKMVGRELKEQYPYVKAKPGNVILKVENLSMGDRVKNVSFEVREGEILGIAGLMGAGRTEVAKLIYGEYKKTSGSIYMDNSKVEISSPMDAIKNRIAYLPEDRKKEGIILKMPVGSNMSLANLKKYERKLKKIDKKMEHKDFKEQIQKLSIKTTGYDQIIKNLSGGNQQKAIFAKWIMVGPRVLIIDEPTRGIDVGAKKEIYEILNELKKSGMAIVMISSEMEEIIGVCDRIIVMHEGKVTGTLSREEVYQEKIMKYAMGLS